MKIAIHQPNYMPWLGYFYKIACCNVFVILDSVLCPGRGYVNRVKDKGPNGERWLTQPIPIKNRNKKIINQVYFADYKWREKHLNVIKNYYGATPYFKEYFPDITNIIRDKTINGISDMNSKFIFLFMEILGLKPRVYFSSELNISDLKSTNLLIEIVKKVGGTTYLSGLGGAKYQDEEKFKENHIELIYSDFKHSVYPQLFNKEFVPGLSVVDLIFNCGPESRKFIIKVS